MKIFKSFNLLVALIGAFILLSIEASAFDGERRGFILGLGIGPGLTSYKQTVSYAGSSESASESKFGFQTDFKIGYAPSNNLAIYYSSKVSWFGMENIMGDNITIANGLAAAAFGYYFEEEGPTPFITGGAGLASWNPVFTSNAEVWRGFGMYFGGGYEFANHFEICGNLIWGNPTTSEGNYKLSTNSVIFQLTLNFMAY